MNNKKEIICEEIAGYLVEYTNPYTNATEEKNFFTEEEMLAFCGTITYGGYSVFKIIRLLIE